MATKDTKDEPKTTGEAKQKVAGSFEEAIEQDEKARQEAAKRVGKSEDEWRAERENAEEEARAQAQAEAEDAAATANTGSGPHVQTKVSSTTPDTTPKKS